jgi:hypothetical protein
MPDKDPNHHGTDAGPGDEHRGPINRDDATTRPVGSAAGESTRIGPYRLLEGVGAGGMGEVWHSRWP